MGCVAFSLRLRARGRRVAAPTGRHQPPCRGVGLAPAVMLGIGLRMWYSASPSIPSSIPYIFASLSLSLLFRQSLLYDSQFNISIRTRLISTKLFPPVLFYLCLWWVMIKHPFEGSFGEWKYIYNRPPVNYHQQERHNSRMWVSDNFCRDQSSTNRDIELTIVQKWLSKERETGIDI